MAQTYKEGRQMTDSYDTGWQVCETWQTLSGEPLMIRTTYDAATGVSTTETRRKIGPPPTHDEMIACIEWAKTHPITLT